MDGPFRDWPKIFAGIPLIVAVLTLAIGMVAARPRATEPGWHGTAIVGIFLSALSALAWTMVLLAQITPTS